MKRLLAALLLFSSTPLWADISITQGAGTTIATDSPGSVNYQKVKVCNGDANTTNCGTIRATGLLVDLSSTSSNATALNVISTATTVSGTITANAGTGSFNVNQSTVAVMNTAGGSLTVAGTVTSNAGTGVFNSFVVNVPSVTFNGNQQPVAANIVSIGTTAVVTGGVSGSLGVGGLAASGAAASGNPLQAGALVSSSTFNTQRADATMVPVTADQYGRIITQGGVPWPMIKVATATIANTVGTVLVSSPAAGTYTFLCSCVVSNTSATPAYLTFAGANLSSSANTIPLYVGATNMSGIWGGCDRPMLRGSAGNAIQMVASASVSSLLVSCQYYQTP